jgi:hypothetical protein
VSAHDDHARSRHGRFGIAIGCAVDGRFQLAHRRDGDRPEGRALDELRALSSAVSLLDRAIRLSLHGPVAHRYSRIL